MGTQFHDEHLRKTLAKNVRAFLVSLEISENALAQRCKLSQKQINNITRARTGCGIDAISELAGVFGCEPWMLLLDRFDKHVSRNRRLGRLVKRYMDAPEADQDLVDALAEKTTA